MLLLTIDLPLMVKSKDTLNTLKKFNCIWHLIFIVIPLNVLSYNFAPLFKKYKIYNFSGLLTLKNEWFKWHNNLKYEEKSHILCDWVFSLFTIQDGLTNWRPNQILATKSTSISSWLSLNLTWSFPGNLR